MRSCNIKVEFKSELRFQLPVNYYFIPWKVREINHLTGNSFLYSVANITKTKKHNYHYQTNFRRKCCPTSVTIFDTKVIFFYFLSPFGRVMTLPTNVQLTFTSCKLLLLLLKDNHGLTMINFRRCFVFRPIVAILQVKRMDSIFK